MTTSLVLEIGTSWLKLALFGTAFGGVSLKGLSILSAANLSEDMVSMGIIDFLKEHKIKKPQFITVSFSRSAVTLRNLRIPSTTASEIDNMIKLHVGRQVPYAKEEIVNGYRVIGQDAMGYSKVMLAIIHRESIRKIFRILDHAGLYTDKVELSSDGILSWLDKATKAGELKKADTFIILDIDAGFTDFIVSTSENILFSRVINQGAQQLTDTSKWQKFIGEMKQTMVISQGEEVIKKPTRIYMSGAIEEIKGLSKNIEAEFNLPVEAMEPLKNVSLAKKYLKNPMETLAKGSVSAVLGLGLEPATKRINFVLPEAQIRKTLKERGKDMIFLGSGLMYLILIVCGIYLEKMHNRESYLVLLEDRYKKIAVSAGGLDESLDRIKKAKSELNMETTAINYLSEISKLLPPEIVVTSISYQKGDKINLKGRALEMTDVPALSTTLEKSPDFKEVQTRYSTRKELKGTEIIEFELVCPFEKEGKEKVKKKKE